MSKNNAKLLGVRTLTITGKGQIALPKELRKKKGFLNGEKLALLAFEDRVELRPLSHVEKIAGALASEKALAKDWLSPADERQWKNL